MSKHFHLRSALGGLLAVSVLLAGGPQVRALPAKSPAAPDSAVGQKGGKAGSILEKAARYHRDAKDMTIRFESRSYNAVLDRESAYQGALWLKGKGLFRLEIPGTQVVCDGRTVWEHNEAGGQVLVKDLEDWNGGALPSETLLRFLDARPISHAEAERDGLDLHKLELDPAGTLDNLESLVVYLRRKDHSVFAIETVDLSGNRTEYRLTRLEKNRGLGDDRFRFKAPKGVEVVDMRE